MIFIIILFPLLPLTIRVTMGIRVNMEWEWEWEWIWENSQWVFLSFFHYTFRIHIYNFLSLNLHFLACLFFFYLFRSLVSNRNSQWLFWFGKPSLILVLHSPKEAIFSHYIPKYQGSLILFPLLFIFPHIKFSVPVYYLG